MLGVHGPVTVLGELEITSNEIHTHSWVGKLIQITDQCQKKQSDSGWQLGLVCSVGFCLHVLLCDPF